MRRREFVKTVSRIGGSAVGGDLLGLASPLTALDRR